VSVIAVSGAAVLVVAFAALALNRAILRPLAQAETAAAGVVAQRLARPVPSRHPGSLASDLAHSLNGLLSQLADARMSTQAARTSSDRMSTVLASACRELRRPVSVVRGCAEYCQRPEPPTVGELDRMMSRIADEAARIEAIIDDLAGGGQDRPQPARRSPRTR
jgi:signal transduction histidine kinase